jgi:hypothetical protein
MKNVLRSLHVNFKHGFLSYHAVPRGAERIHACGVYHERGLGFVEYFLQGRAVENVGAYVADARGEGGGAEGRGVDVYCGDVVEVCGEQGGDDGCA